MHMKVLIILYDINLNLNAGKKRKICIYLLRCTLGWITNINLSVIFYFIFHIEYYSIGLRKSTSKFWRQINKIGGGGC